MEPIPGAAWRRSSFSGGNGGNCVEVTTLDHDCVCCPDAKRGEDPIIVVRDSKDPSGPHLHFTVAEWDAFTAGVVAGEFDIEALGAVPA